MSVSRRNGGNLAGQPRVMGADRHLRGVVPSEAVARARAAAVAAGWSEPDSTQWQGRISEGKGRSVKLRLFIASTASVLGIHIEGSFG